MIGYGGVNVMLDVSFGSSICKCFVDLNFIIVKGGVDESKLSVVEKIGDEFLVDVYVGEWFVLGDIFVVLCWFVLGV